MTNDDWLENEKPTMNEDVLFLWKNGGFFPASHIMSCFSFRGGGVKKNTRGTFNTNGSQSICLAAAKQHVPEKKHVAQYPKKNKQSLRVPSCKLT